MRLRNPNRTVRARTTVRSTVRPAWRQRWLAVWLQGRRRKRQQPPPPDPPLVPLAPGQFDGQIVDGMVVLTWSMAGVGLADGCSIEARPLQNGAVWVEVG